MSGACSTVKLRHFFRCSLCVAIALLMDGCLSVVYGQGIPRRVKPNPFEEMKVPPSSRVVWILRKVKWKMRFGGHPMVTTSRTPVGLVEFRTLRPDETGVLRLRQPSYLGSSYAFSLFFAGGKDYEAEVIVYGPGLESCLWTPVNTYSGKRHPPPPNVPVATAGWDTLTMNLAILQSLERWKKALSRNRDYQAELQQLLADAVGLTAAQLVSEEPIPRIVAPWTAYGVPHTTLGRRVYRRNEKGYLMLLDVLESDLERFSEFVSTPKPAPEALRECKPERRWLAALSLAKGREEALPVLTAALDDGEGGVVSSALFALGCMGAEAGPAGPAAAVHDGPGKQLLPHGEVVVHRGHEPRPVRRR